jgi:hypothetical protein
MGFAILGPLARRQCLLWRGPVRDAPGLVAFGSELVHRLVGLIHAASPRSLTTSQLRFSSDWVVLQVSHNGL